MAEDRIVVLEGEVDALREERETLLTRVAELEAELATAIDYDRGWRDGHREALAGGGQ